jgi:hypothetical protein
MLALRYAAVLALVMWIGGFIALGALAAPVVFDVLGARGAEGRVLAGTLFGEMMRRFHSAAYVCGGVIVASLASRAVLGPRPRHFALRLATSAVMLGSATYSGLVLSPRIEQAQRMLGVSPSTLPDSDPRRADFGRLHGLSTSLQLVPVIGGLALLFWESKD